MRIVVEELDKDGNKCWTTYLNNHQLSIYYSEEEAQKNINTVILN